MQGVRRVLPKVRLTQYGQNVSHNSGILLQQDLISYPDNRGALARFFRKGPVDIGRPGELTELLEAGHFIVEIFGRRYHLGLEEGQTIGAGGSEHIPVNPQLLLQLVDRVLLGENDVSLDTTAETTRLHNNGAQTVLVLRHGQGARAQHKVFIVRNQDSQPYSYNGNLTVLNQPDPKKPNYLTNRLVLPSQQFIANEVRQKLGGSGFVLEPNDTILLCLGRKNEDLGHSNLLWLPIVFRPEDPQNVAFSPNIVPTRLADLGVDQLPDQVAQAINVEALILIINQRKGLMSYINLVEQEFDIRHRHVVERLAAQAAHTTGQNYDTVLENMALNWLAKIEAFNMIAHGFGFQIVGKVAQDEGVAVLAVSQNGSLLSVSRGKTERDPLTGQNKRAISYVRIEARVEVDIQSFTGQEGHLRADLKVGQPAQIGSANLSTTSPLMLLAASAQATDALLNKAAVVSHASFAAIDERGWE